MESGDGTIPPGAEEFKFPPTESESNREVDEAFHYYDRTHALVRKYEQRAADERAAAGEDDDTTHVIFEPDVDADGNYVFDHQPGSQNDEASAEGSVEGESETEGEQTPEEKAAAWREVLEAKVFTPENQAMMTPEQTRLLFDCFAEIMRSDILSPEALDAMLEGVTIMTETKIAPETNSPYIGGANRTTRILELYPEFFDPNQTHFDPVHVLGHELGHLAYGLFDQQVYRGMKQSRDYMNGEYVNKFESVSERMEEEFAETFADVIRASSGFEAAQWRQLRIKDPELIRWLSTSPEGLDELDAFYSESHEMYSFIKGAMKDVPEKRKQQDEQRAAGRGQWEGGGNNDYSLFTFDTARSASAPIDPRKMNAFEWWWKFLGIH